MPDPPCIISRFLYQHRGCNTVVKEDLINTISNLIDRLPPTQKEIIRLRFCEKNQHDEIARIMSVNLNATYSLLYKSLENLRQQLGTTSLPDMILFLEYYFF